MSSTKSSSNNNNNNPHATYYYTGPTGPSYYMNEAYSGSGQSFNTFNEMDKTFIHPQFYSQPPHPFMGQPSVGRTRETKAKCIAPCFALLFVFFLMSTIAVVLAWAILSDGFKKVDTRTSTAPTESSPSRSALSKPYESISGTNEGSKTDTTQQKIGKSEMEENYQGPLSTPYPPYREQLPPLECTTAECVQVASKMLENLNTKVDPCADFYEYACGGYGEQRVLAEDRRRMNTLSEMSMQLKRQLKKLLEEPRKFSDPLSTRLAKTFFESCMDVGTVDELGPGPLLRFAERFGRWPVTQKDWSGRNYKWEAQAGNLRRYGGVEAVLSVFIYVDMEDSHTRLITIDQPVLGLGSREYYMKGKGSEVVGAYLDYMVETAILFGAEEQVARRDMEAVLDFEMRIANISIPEVERRDHSKLFNPITLRNLKASVPYVNWDVFLKTTFSNTDIRLTDSEKLNIIGLPYIQSVGSVLKTADERTMANYFMWNLFSSYTIYLPQSYRKPYNKFRVVLNGVTQDPPRWTECVKMTRGFMSWPVSYMYVKKHFQPEAKNEMQLMVENLRSVMGVMIRDADWMDVQTKKDALLKLRRMGEKIGYPEYINNQTRVLDGLTGVSLFNNTYFMNVIRVTQKRVRKTLNEVRELVNQTEWDASPAVVNAFYSFSKNEIVFPAGILQFPVFTLGAPRYINYPRIGMVIGHEITHGYDDQGRQYDEHGNVKAWWNADTLEQFTEDAQCFIRQYGSITEPVSGKMLNGKLTVGENIADNGGLRIASNAYTQWKKAKNVLVEQTLPGFQNYTNQQMFFLSYANGWCEIIRPRAIDFYLTLDPHALAKYRVNVPLQNYAEFSKAFQCPTGTAMNPTRKCRIW